MKYVFFKRNNNSKSYDKISVLVAELEEGRLKDKYRPRVDNEEVLIHNFLCVFLKIESQQLHGKPVRARKPLQ